MLGFACSQPARTSSHQLVVTEVYPSSDTLPENLLRMYIQFSKPMKTVGNLEKIKLVDEQGQEVSGAIFDNVYELWDREQKQLTLLFDPGRVKTGLRANQTMGRALASGRHYRLIINELEDVTHHKLDEAFTKNLFIVAADTIPPNLDHWVLEAPQVGTQQPLTIRFPDILDQLSLQQRLMVTDTTPERLLGEVGVGGLEKSWEFVPHTAWQAGTYFVYVNARLEDPAGNNLNGLFDHKVGSLTHVKEGQTLRLAFRVD